MSRCRVQLIYSGRVQGVGFRYTVKQVAAGYDVAGTVRNLPDGRVELVAEPACKAVPGVAAMGAKVRGPCEVSISPMK